MITRILSGLVMAVVVILAIFKLPAMAFNFFALLLMLGGLILILVLPLKPMLMLLVRDIYSLT